MRRKLASGVVIIVRRQNIHTHIIYTQQRYKIRVAHALELPVCSIDAEGIQQLGAAGSLRAHSHTGRRPCTVHGRRCRLSFGVCRRRRRLRRDPTQAADYKEPVCGCGGRRRCSTSTWECPSVGVISMGEEVSHAESTSLVSGTSQLTNAGDLHYFRLARPGRFSHFHLPAPNQSAHRPFCADACLLFGQILQSGVGASWSFLDTIFALWRTPRAPAIWVPFLKDMRTGRRIRTIIITMLGELGWNSLESWLSQFLNQIEHFLTSNIHFVGLKHRN